MTNLFSLEAILPSNDCVGSVASISLEQLSRSLEDASKSLWLVHANSLRITDVAIPVDGDVPPRWAAVFVPSVVSESGHKADLPPSRMNKIREIETPTCLELSRFLLSMIHPLLAEKFLIKLVLTVQKVEHCPSDVVLLDLSNTSSERVAELLDLTQGHTMQILPDAILKVLLIRKVSFRWEEQRSTGLAVDWAYQNHTTTSFAPSSARRQACYRQMR
jgi:hypothetical protein